MSEVKFGEGAGTVVRKCKRLSLVKVPCCQEVSEVEFGEGTGITVRKCQRLNESASHVVRKCQKFSLVKVPKLLSRLVSEAEWRCRQCCQEVSEVEFGEGAMLSGGVRGGVW